MAIPKTDVSVSLTVPQGRTESNPVFANGGGGGDVGAGVDLQLRVINGPTGPTNRAFALVQVLPRGGSEWVNMVTPLPADLGSGITTPWTLFIPPGWDKWRIGGYGNTGQDVMVSAVAGRLDSFF